MVQEVTAALTRVCAGDFKTLCYCPFPWKVLVEISKAIKTQMEMDSQKNEKCWSHQKNSHKNLGIDHSSTGSPSIFHSVPTQTHSVCSLDDLNSSLLSCHQKYPSSSSNALTVLLLQRKHNYEECHQSRGSPRGPVYKVRTRSPWAVLTVGQGMAVAGTKDRTVFLT